MTSCLVQKLLPAVSKLVQTYCRLSSACENLNFPEKRVDRFHEISQSVCRHPRRAVLPPGWRRQRGKHRACSVGFPIAGGASDVGLFSVGLYQGRPVSIKGKI